MEATLSPPRLEDLGSEDGAARPRAGVTLPRVLVIFGNIPLLGQERGNIQVFNALKARGADALFVTHAGWGWQVIQPELDRLGHAWTMATYPKLFSRGMTPGEWGERLRALGRGVREFVRIARTYRPTHIHAGNVSFFLSMLPALWWLRTPVVYRLGDAPQQHRPLFKFIWRRLVVPRVSRFVCVSHYIRNLLLEAGAPPDRVRVIYSYPSARAVQPEPFDLLDDAFEGRTVAYLGQLSEEKGVGMFVEAALRLCRERADVRFVLAGDYTWQNPFAEALMQRVEDEGYADRIRFVGYVENIPGLLAAASVHACPSVCAEALSNTVVEAKQAGVPSVVFPSGGLPELIVEQGADGWVCEAPTAAALQAGLDHFLTMDDATLEASGHAARASMETLGITEDAFAARWLEVYGLRAQPAPSAETPGQA